MTKVNEPIYAETVRRAIKAINPSVTDAAQTYGWPAALDAASTILMSLLIAAVGGDEARAACSRMYAKVTRLEHAWAPVLALVTNAREEPQGRA
jgi:hypothetical protein